MPQLKNLSNDDRIRLDNKIGTVRYVRRLRPDPIGESPPVEVCISTDEGETHKHTFSDDTAFVPYLGRNHNRTVCEFQSSKSFVPSAREVTSTDVELACRVLGIDVEDMPTRNKGRWLDGKAGDFLARTNARCQILVTHPETEESHRFIPELFNLDWDIEAARDVQSKFRDPFDSPQRFSSFVARVINAAAPPMPGEIGQDEFKDLMKRLGMPVTASSKPWADREVALFFDSERFPHANFHAHYHSKTDSFSCGGNL